MKTVILIFSILFFTTIHSQNLYHKIIGDLNNSSLKEMKSTPDGGTILIGTADELGNENILLMKLDSVSETVWSKKYDFNTTDEGKSVLIDSNGNYIFVGETIDLVNNKDIVIVKTNNLGNVTWSRQIGGINDDGINKIIATSDGGYLLIAYTMSYGSGAQDLYLIKLDSSGNLIWNSIIGNSAADIPYSAIELSNGDFIITGLTSNGIGSADFLFLRVNSLGNLLSNKNIGSSEYEYGEDIILRNNGNGFAIIGSVNNPSSNKLNTLVLLTDSFGTPTLARSIGGLFYNNIGHNIHSVYNGYLIAGSTEYSSKDALLFRMRENGYVEWYKHYGGNYNEEAFSIYQNNDKSILIGANSNSFNQMTNNIYLTQVDSNGYSECYNKSYNFSIPQSLSYTTASPTLNTIYTLKPITSLSISSNSYTSSNNTICPKTSFRKVIYDGKGSVGSKILHSYQDGYIVSGSSRNWSTVPSISLCNTDDEGTPIWMNTYLTSNQNDNMISTSMDYTSDNGYIICGYFPYPQNGGIILKTDSLGNIMWSNRYDGGNHVQFNDIKTTKNGDFIVIGSTTNASTGTGSTERFFVLKISNSGALIWEKTYNYNNYGSEPKALKLTDSDEIVVTGHINGGNLSQGGNNPFICKIDSSGNVIFFKSINQVTNTANNLMLTYDKGVVLTGEDRTSSGPYLWVIKVDSLGNIAWSNKYLPNCPVFGSSIAIGNSVTENSNKSISILGKTEFSTWNNHYPFYLTLNSAGNVSDGHIFGGVGTDNGVDLINNFDQTNTLLITSKTYREPGLLGGDLYRNLLIVKEDYCDETTIQFINKQTISNTISDIVPTVVSNLNSFTSLSLTKQPLSPSIGNFDPYSYFSLNAVGLGDTVIFNGNISSGSSFYWDFGDGTYDSTNINPTHIYNPNGNYQACLTVTSSCGSKTYCDSTCTNANPISISTTNWSPCLGDSVMLFISNGNLNNAENWKWYLGTCGTNPIDSGSSIYVQPQSNTTYFVRGEGGCTSPSTCKSINIAPYILDTSIIQIGNTLTSNATGVSYKWIDCNTNSYISGATNLSYTPTTNGLYSVQVSNGICKDTSSCYSIIITNLQENNIQKDISIHPNPVKDKLEIHLSKNHLQTTLFIRDLNGKELMKFNYHNQKIIKLNLKELANGVYLIDITNDGNKTMLKFIKEM